MSLLKYQISPKKFVLHIIFWLTILNFFPFIFVDLQFYPSISSELFLFGSIIMGVILMYKKVIIVPSNILLSMLIPLLWNLPLLAIHNDSAYLSSFIALFCTYIGFLYILNVIGLRPFVNVFIWIILVMCFLTSIAFFLGLLGYIKPISTFIRGPKLFYNFGIVFAKVVTPINDKLIIRSGGYFDEPGTLAFFSLYALLLNEIYLKKRFFSLVIVLLSLSTFSFAFIIIVFIYYLIKSIKNFPLFIFLISMCCVILLGSVYLHFNHKDPVSNQIYYLTVRRVLPDSSGGFYGDNRSNLFANSLKTMKTYPLWGSGRSTADEFGFIGANLLMPFARDGIPGGIFYYFPFLLLIYLVSQHWKFTKRLDVIELGLLVSLFLNFMQRPMLERGLESVVFFLFLYILGKGMNRDTNSSEKEQKKLRIKTYIK